MRTIPDVRPHWLRRIVWPRSLSARLTLLAIATLLPITALTVFHYIEDQRERRDLAVQEATEYARSAAVGMENFAQDLESLALAASLSLGSDAGPITNESHQPFLKALTEESGVLRAAFVTDTDGRIIAQQAGDDTGRDLSSRPYISELQAGADAVWTAALEGVQSGQLTVAYSEVIRDPESGATRGYLVLAFYPAVLSERLPVPERGNIVLVDQNGRVLFSSADPQRAVSAQDISADADIAAALAGREVVFQGRETAFESGDRFGAVAPIPTMSWALAYTRSQSRLEASLRSGLLRDLGLLGLIGATSVGALLLVARQVSRPLASLSQAAANIHDGKPVQLDADSSDPDVARLQRAFITMRTEVERRETQLTEQARVLSTLERAGHLLASDLDFRATVQAVTDAGVRVTEASYGALMYNTANEAGESFQQFTVSGADRAEFERFGLPRPTGVFGPTFRGESTIRLDDVSQDPRYGRNAPFAGTPPGHLPVRSYLAVPVTSRDGDILGGLFFGHPEPGMFTARHEELAVGIASWASIALSNARLYESATEGQRELAKALAAKDEFLGLVSHELRTPITVILGAATHLAERHGSVDPESEVALLKDMRDNANRLSLLVHNILVLARLDRLGNAGEPVLLRRPIEQVVEEFRARNPTRPVELTLENPSTVVLGSSLYVEQVLGNLLSNADKYSPADAPIEVEVLDEGETVELRVRDRGPGLSPEDEAHIFEPYYRGQEAQQRANGFGLGLPVCKALLEAMSGQLSFAPHPDGGTVFSVTLPTLVEAAEVEAEREMAS